MSIRKRVAAKLNPFIAKAREFRDDRSAALVAQLSGEAAKINADMHAEARGELNERTHVIDFLIACGHRDLAEAIARERHWTQGRVPKAGVSPWLAKK